MNPEELQKNIALYYSKLPPKAQEVFSKMEWLTTLQKISDSYHLDDQQKEVLGTETTLLLLGIIHSVEYEENLTKEIKISPDSLDKMLEEIRTSILKDIQQQLLDTFNANKQTEVAETGEIVSNIDSRLDKLPPEILKIIRESNYQAELYDIAKKHKLSVTQMGSLEKVITNLITSTIHPNEFKNALTKVLDIPPEELSELVDEINSGIFKKIREKLVGEAKKDKDKQEPLPPESVNMELPKEDMTLLKSQGIEIIPEKLEIAEPKPAPHPILAQKLSGPFQVPTVKSNYGTNNVPLKTEEVVPANAPEPKTSTYPPKADPYREMPE